MKQWVKKEGEGEVREKVAGERLRNEKWVEVRFI